MCNIYYGYIERAEILKSMLDHEDSHDAHELMMRFTDDFLLITTSQNRARSFEKIMRTGLSKYGCTINPMKTQVRNFTVDDPYDISELVKGRHAWKKVNEKEKSPLQWCGLIIDPISMTIRVNYVM